MRVSVKPEMLSWARMRSRRDAGYLEMVFPELPQWERGEAKPTFKQLEEFSKKTYTPFGYFFLAQPPQESVPIADLRTIGNKHIGNPSPSLLDTIYLCQQRQDWYRDFAQSIGENPLPFVGSVTLQSDVTEVAEGIRNALGFKVEERRKMKTWPDPLRKFIEQADSFGVMVMVSGIVGSNTRRPLDPEEFRGFALADSLAPLVFINGKDVKAAQMFTLAHELAHIWLGETALSDVPFVTVPHDDVEVWCNQVAAELLVPHTALREIHKSANPFKLEVARLALWFKVSNLVILRRLHDTNKITRDEFWDAYNEEVKKWRREPQTGGHAIWNLSSRVGRRFGRDLIISTLEGKTLYRDAFRLLGLRTHKTFREFGSRLGIVL